MSSEDIDPLIETLAVGNSGSTLATIEPSPSLLPKATGSIPELPLAVVGEAGDFAVRSELGRGGMGVVELAEQKALKREVAIKRLSIPSQKAEEALLREALITGQLEHPNIVPVHALINDGSGPAVIMKRISGETWLDAISHGGRGLGANLSIFQQVCNATAYAHSKGIIHRDIKPENVMLGEYGEVYLVDWGLAIRSDGPPPSGVAGTPAYMPPEYLEGKADERSDIFLLGATLHHAITGQARYTKQEILDALLDARACAPHQYGDSTPEELGAICNRACAKDPRDRFSSVTELRDAVQVYIAHRSANDLSEAAEARLDELLPMIEAKSDADYPHAQRLFNEARFGFQQALRAWPESPTAIEGFETTLEQMTRYELALKHPEQASALLDAMSAPPKELRDEVERLREELLAERERLEQLEQDQDRGFGAGSRTRAQLLLGISVVALTAILVSLRIAFPSYATGAMRLAITGVIVFALTAGIIAWWRRRGEWNLINRRIAQVALGTLGMSMLNRFAALAADAPASQTLLVDAFLIGLGGLALTPFQRSGPLLATVAIAVGFVGAMRPELIQTLFVALAIFIPLAVLSVVATNRKLRGRGKT